ncbi:hypothetical protein, partial [Staphylococcus hominis]|uniref:hypothetical protein n=1 Tax=Staphylococcus hominis TaxID=1290 RepID=UPI0037095CD4
MHPIKFHLLFHPFLNPQPLTIPHIHIHFHHTTTQKLIQYLQQNYPQYHLSPILTFPHLLPTPLPTHVAPIIRFDQETLNQIS